MVTTRYETIDHTADVAFIAYGATLEELFENAAFAMFDITFDLSEASGRISRPIVADGDTPEELLVNWLNELLVESETRGLAFSRFGVDRLEEGGVQGWASGDSIDDVSLAGAPVKAATHHDLAIVEIPDGWWARVVLDV
ncbi:MAG TPA: archease [Acidimicrobiia bacterium]|nr:archease [Acidimicrobiia bacterium]